MNFRASAQRGRRAATVVDITALVDVVFQLLIFFLLTSSYVSQQSQQAPQVPVELPESSLEAQSQPVEDFVITVDNEGDIFVEGRERVSLDELAIRLARAAETNANTVVLIRADQQVPYGKVAEVMSVARISRLKISAVLRNR